VDNVGTVYCKFGGNQDPVGVVYCIRLSASHAARCRPQLAITLKYSRVVYGCCRCYDSCMLMVTFCRGWMVGVSGVLVLGAVRACWMGRYWMRHGVTPPRCSPRCVSRNSATNTHRNQFFKAEHHELHRQKKPLLHQGQQDLGGLHAWGHSPDG
jgi:hypothetical protein